MKKLNMLQLDETLISRDVLDQKFSCDLSKCKGICCVHGDAGAPLTKEEVTLLPEIIEKIKPFLRSEGVQAIQEQGTHVIDDEDETVTPLINGEECAYVIFEKGIAFCGIEKAFRANEINFQKPLSCHLYPIRIRRYEQFTAVNYDTWDICAPACSHGEKLNVPVFEFTKDALIRRFGEDWYKKLQQVNEELKRQEK